MFLFDQQSQHDTTGDGSTEYTGQIRAHGMHDQEVLAVFLLSDKVRYTSRNWDRGDTSRTNQRIDLATADLVHDAGADNTRACAENKGNEAKRDDQQRVRREEGVSGHR